MLKNEKFTKHSRSLLVDEACPDIDYRYGPWPSVEEAFEFLVANEVNAVGLTIGVETKDGIVEYWFQSKADSIEDLIEKESGVTVEEDPTVPLFVKDITEEDINNWNDSILDENQLAAVDSGITKEKVEKYDSMIGLGINLTQLDWIKSLMLGELQKKANSAIKLVQTNGTLVYYKDEISTSPTSSTTVYLEYDGNKIKATDTPEGWTYSTSNKTYSKSITTSSSAPVANFFYTFPGGEFEGLTVQKDSSPVSISVVNPAWYGLLPADKCDSIDDIVAYVNANESPLTRIKSSMGTTKKSYTVSLASYLIIVVKNSATAIQYSTSIISKLFDIPSDYSSKSYLQGYKIYKSNLSIGKDTTIDISITL